MVGSCYCSNHRSAEPSEPRVGRNSRLGEKLGSAGIIGERSLLSAEPHWANRDASGEASYGRSRYNYARTYDPSTGRYLEPPVAPPADVEDMAAVEEPIEDRGGEHLVAGPPRLPSAPAGIAPRSRARRAGAQSPASRPLARQAPRSSSLPPSAAGAPSRPPVGSVEHRPQEEVRKRSCPLSRSVLRPATPSAPASRSGAR